MEASSTSGTAVAKSMGIERTGYGKGFTPEEALQNWLDTDPEFEKEVYQDEGEPLVTRFGDKALDRTKQVNMACMREPYVPKRCKTEIVKQQGSRQWETKHVVYTVDGGERLGAGDTKAEAIALGRTKALEEDAAVHIKVEKQLTEGAAIEAIITPKVKRPGRWKFKASFLF